MNEVLENIGFLNSWQNWHIVLLICFLILGAYWEFSKAAPRKWIRFIALAIVFISLYLMYLTPFVLSEKPKKSVLLLNKYLNKEQVDSLQLNNDLPILQQAANSTYRNVKSSTLVQLNKLAYQIDTAYVVGYIPQLNPAYYKVRSDMEVVKGIKLDYNRSIAIGDSLRVTIENCGAKPVTISGNLGQDSLAFDLAKGSVKTVAVLPKSAGYQLCKISTRNQSFHFPVEVKEADKYVIQILAATPDFEWKFFADFLKTKDHLVYQKTEISTGKFKSSFYNWSESLQMSRGVVKDLKILFADAKAWENLTADQQGNFMSVLQENRGSLIVRSNPNSQIKLNLDKPKSTNIFSTSDKLLEEEYHKYLQFNNINQLDEVLKNSVFRKVKPKIILGIINFQNSYQLKLSGKNSQYERLWSPVFQKLVRSSSSSFYQKSEWAVQHQPFFFSLWGNDELNELPVISPAKDTLKVAAKDDLLYPERKHYNFYPRDTGWHFLKVDTYGNSIPFYVHEELNSNESEFLSDYNYSYLNYLKFTRANIQSAALKYNRKFVTLWIFLLFVLCAGYLWIEDKIT